MIAEWLLNVMMLVVSILGGGAFWYFLSQKQFHHALWTFVFAAILLIVAGALHIRNGLILKETKEGLTPKLKVSITPEDWPTPSLTKHKYPLQEYTFDITNDNMDSVSVQNLTIELFFPYIISQVRGRTYLHSGGNAWVRGMQMVEVRNGKVIRTEEEPAESFTAKSMDFSVQQWEENGKHVNSHIAVLSCEEFPQRTAFTGSIVVDLTKEPKGMIKTPEEIGKYVGNYNYSIMGKKFPTVQMIGSIPKPNIGMKLAEHHYDLGMELMKKDECDQAIIKFSSTIDLNPKHDHAYFKRAYCYANIGEYDKAILDFDKVVEITPKYAKAYFYRAIAKKKSGDPDEETEKDFLIACNLKFEKGCKEYWSSKLSTINPSDGWLSYTPGKEDWLEPNNEFINITPHVSKGDFEIHLYRDKDNVFKALTSNAFSKKVILQYEDLERLKSAPNHPKHEIKMVWYKGENKLYINGVLVDVYPKEVESSSDELKEETSTDKKSDGDLFRALYNIGPEKGRIGFTVSKEGWLEDDGKFINILPHIYVSEHNFEVHGYRDKDFIFKVLISTPFSQDVILSYSDLEGLKDYPDYPKLCIWVTWNKEEKNLYIDGTEAVDTYPKKR